MPFRTNDKSRPHPSLNKRVIVEWIDKFSYKIIFLFWVANAATFSLIYALLSYSPGNGPTTLEGLSFGNRLLNSLYYSIITATNTGYGDIVPQGISRAFAAAESFTGLFLFALFMARLVSRYQDVAIRQMHKISMEGNSHAIREDLFIVRRDFEHIMNAARRSHALSNEDWDRLAVAFKQITNLFHEIPNFYDKQHNLYVIDTRREELLFEAFHRTLHRLNRMLACLQKEHVDWTSHHECVAELAQLLKASEKFVPLWRDRSSYKMSVQFDEVLRIVASIRTQIQAVSSIPNERQHVPRKSERNAKPKNMTQKKANKD